MPPNAVKTRLQYLIYTGEKPVYYASVGGAAAELKVSARFDEREVVVHDARQIEATLDTQGFSLRPHPTGVEDELVDQEEGDGQGQHQDREAVQAAGAGCYWRPRHPHFRPHAALGFPNSAR